MPRYQTSQEWLEQSTLLIQARPTTTRISTSYKIKTPKPRPAKASDSSADTPMPDAKPPRGFLTLKTFDPISGAALKYRTHKAAEVSRLILALGRLSRAMAGLPDLKEDEPAAERADEQQPAAADTTEKRAPQQQQAEQPPSSQAQGGGGKKKKKGKK